MKTICDGCGTGNDLGRLFCTRCGAKLDLTRISDDLEREQAILRRKGLFKLVFLPVFILAAATAILVGIPARPFRTAAVPKGRVEATELTLARLGALADGLSGPQPVQPPIRADDLNAWLAGPAGKPFGVRSLTLTIKPEILRLRVVDSSPPVALWKGKVRIPPLPYSYEVSGTATNGPFRVTGARLGHLPLFGPLRRYAADAFARMLQQRPREWRLLNSLADIRFEEDQVSAVVGARRP